MREIILTQDQVALVDDANFAWLNKWSWCATYNPTTRTFYAMRKVRVEGKDITIYMARLILGLTDSEIEADHKNFDTLDNQLHNLRRATSQQSKIHRRKNRNNTSGFKGVCWSGDHKKWLSRIRLNSKYIHLGYFEFGNLEDAARAYDKKVVELHGEFAVLNFPAIDCKIELAS